MMAKTRARARRLTGWPFGPRGNRRVRALVAPAAPAQPAMARRGLAWLRRSGRVGLLALLTTLAGAAAVCAHASVIGSAHFQVRALRLSPTRHVSAEALHARAAVALGTNLFRVDLDQVARDLLKDPWVASAQARRELPSTLVLDLVEREAACAVALGSLYLADAPGLVFKRATPDEAATLPVVTGIDRDRYLADPDGARAEIREALALLEAWRSATRPVVGEIHRDRAGATLYLASGPAVKVGRVDDTLAARLRRFDTVWAALAVSGEQAQIIYLDNRARPERVTVKLAQAAGHAPPT